MRKNVDQQKDEIQRLTHQVKIAQINKENAEKNEEQKRVEKVRYSSLVSPHKLESSLMTDDLMADVLHKRLQL